MKYFKDSEFVRPELLRPEMKDLLDYLRELYGSPLIVSSSLRSDKKNASVGGAGQSSHRLAPDGLYSGIDLTTPSNKLTGAQKFRLVHLAIDAGFSRIGIYEKHIHLDIEKHLPQDVLWIGVD